MPHKRSPEALRKRIARKIIFGTSFHDPLLSETIARTNIRYIENNEYPSVIVNVEHGEVLHDERARGTMD